MEASWGGIVGILAAGGILSGLIELLINEAREARQRQKKIREESIEERMLQLVSSFRDALRLISEIEQNVKERSALAKKLEEDIATYSNIKDLKKGEVEAVAQVLRAELKRESRKSFWAGAAINLLFFVLGFGASFLLK